MRVNAFLRERTLDRYLAARDAMLVSRRYDPKSTVLPDVYRLLGRGLYHQVPRPSPQDRWRTGS
jgi:hypothetical protein